MKTLTALALLLSATPALATDLVCTGSNAIYGNIISLSLNAANGEDGPTLTVTYGDAGNIGQEIAFLDSSSDTESKYLTPTGVLISVPKAVMSSSSPEVTVRFSNSAYPSETATCSL